MSKYLTLFSFLLMAHIIQSKCVMYLTGYAGHILPVTCLTSFRQHYVVPEPSLVSEVTHVALAFMQSSIFNEAEPSAWPLFTTVEKVRSQFAKDTAIMVAIGGWGDTQGFSLAAATESSRKLFASNIRKMVEDTGADGW